MHVIFVNPKSREKLPVKIGWSWTCFLFSGFFGAPLFLRRAYGWGAVMCVLEVLFLAGMGDMDSDPDAGGAVFLIWLVQMGLSVYFGLTANKRFAISLLERDWHPLDPDSQEFKWAKQKWALA